MTQGYYKRVFAKKVEYKGIEFRSKMEADFAMFLDGKPIQYKGVWYFTQPKRWEYESKEFELIPQEVWVDKTERDTSVKTLLRNKKHTLQRVIYTPDFYLPDYDLYVEVKGRQFDDELFALRFRLFKHQYPNVAIWKVCHHDEFGKIDDVIKALQISRKKD